MRSRKLVHALTGFCLALGLTALPARPVLTQDLTDPYQILEKHFQAIGGLEKIKAERTKYFEATVSVMGLEGTVKEWEESPVKKRQEVDLKMLKITSGDNGEYAWTVDQNGKVTIQKDEVTLKRREVERRLADYEQLDPNSKYFKVTLQGIEPCDSGTCYVVRIANTINDDVRLEYIDTADFMERKVDLVTPSMEMLTTFSDFRDVGGLKVPFRQEGEVKPIEQKQTIQVTKYETNVSIDPAIFEPPRQDVVDFKFAHGWSAENVPFQLMGDHIFLDVTVNCDRRLWVLDTGAGATVVDSAYAAEIGLASEGTFKAVGAGKTVGAAFVDLPGYSVDGIEFNAQKAAAISIAPLFKRAGIDIAGVLGFDFLSRFVTRIDFAGKTVSFYLPDSFKYEGDGKVIDAPLRENMFELPMTVAGKYSGLWSLDIGASNTSFFYTYAQKNGLLEMKGLEGIAGGAGGYFRVLTAKFDSADIDGFTLGEQFISVPLEKGGALGAREETGNLGNDILRHFVIYLDYKHQQVIFEKGADFATDFPRSKAGLALVVSDTGTIEVFYVAAGSPAEKSGFEPGDRVLSINGIPVERFAGLVAISELFKEREGTVFEFEISRRGETRNLKLTLKELL